MAKKILQSFQSACLKIATIAFAKRKKWKIWRFTMRVSCVRNVGVEETRPSTVVCNDSTHILIHCSEMESVLALIDSFYNKTYCSDQTSNTDMFQ